MATPSQLAFIAWAGIVGLACSAAGFVVVPDQYLSWSRAERLAMTIGFPVIVIVITMAGTLTDDSVVLFLILVCTVLFELVQRQGYLLADRVESRRGLIAAYLVGGAFLAAYFGGRFVIAPHV